MGDGSLYADWLITADTSIPSVERAFRQSIDELPESIRVNRVVLITRRSLPVFPGTR
jgi:hypothetical protein